MDAPEKKVTVGKFAHDLMAKDYAGEVSVIDLERQMQSEYMNHLMDCIDSHHGIFPGDFYIQVITKNEKLLPNVFRNYFAARRSCPTPDYDQTVFKYNKQTATVEYIWTIPSRDACHYLLANARDVVAEERHLLSFVASFETGDLGKQCLILNGEKSANEGGIVSIIH